MHLFHSHAWRQGSCTPCSSLLLPPKHPAWNLKPSNSHTPSHLATVHTANPASPTPPSPDPRVPLTATPIYSTQTPFPAISPCMERIFPTPVLHPISHPAPALHPLVSCGCPNLNVSQIILKTELLSCTSHMSRAPHPHMASGCCQGRCRCRPPDKFCWTAAQPRAGNEQEQKRLYALNVLHPAL